MNTNFDLVVRCQDCGTPVNFNLDCPECDPDAAFSQDEDYKDMEDSFIDAYWEEP